MSFIYGNHEFRMPIRYNATKVVGEYGEQARLQHRLHLSPDANGKWVKWEDYKAMQEFLSGVKVGVISDSQKLEYMTKRKSHHDWVAGKDFTK